MGKHSDFKKVKHGHHPGDVPKADKIAMREGSSARYKSFQAMVESNTRAVNKRRGLTEVLSEIIMSGPGPEDLVDAEPWKPYLPFMAHTLGVYTRTVSVVDAEPGMIVLKPEGFKYVNPADGRVKMPLVSLNPEQVFITLLAQVRLVGKVFDLTVNQVDSLSERANKSKRFSLVLHCPSDTMGTLIARRAVPVPWLPPYQYLCFTYDCDEMGWMDIYPEHIAMTLAEMPTLFLLETTK